MTTDQRIACIAAARARNLEPWNGLRALGGSVKAIKTGDDVRIRDIARALAADSKQARRLLLRVAWNDVRVVWHTVRLALWG